MKTKYRIYQECRQKYLEHERMIYSVFLKNGVDYLEFLRALDLRDQLKKDVADARAAYSASRKRPKRNQSIHTENYNQEDET